MRRPMNVRAFRTLVYADSRMLWRDPLLGWILALPIGLALLLRSLTPRVQQALLAGAGFDLTSYYPLVMGGYLMTAPGMVGMVIGFLLLDERDARTLTALRTTPLSMRQYLAYRVVLPLLLGTASTLIGYPVTGLTPLPLTSLLPIVVVASLSAPLLALILGLAAPNKVAGFAVVKVLNAVNLLPIVVYFVPRPVQYAAGIFPTYWPMRAFWSAAVGETFGGYLVVGIVVAALALLLAAWRFDQRLLRHG
jgi:fluoroquinolone transport system permease protein